MLQYFRITCLSYVFSILSFSIPVVAAIEPSLLIHAASDRIYNGVSENANQPVIALNAELQVTYHWTAGIQFQNAKTDDSDRNRNVSSYIGYDKKVSTNWLSSTYFTHRAFPGTERDWDYNELSSRLTHINGFSAAVSYAPNYYSSSVKAITTSIDYAYTLQESNYLKATIGNVSIPSLFSYQFIGTAIGVNHKRFNAELGYHWVSETNIATPVGTIASSKFVFSMSYLAF